MAVENKTVLASENDIRLDRWFKRHYPNVTHGMIEKCLRKKNIRVNQTKASANQRLKTGDIIRVHPFDVATPTMTTKKLSANEIKLIQSLVIYKDEEVIVLNKPAGLAVQGGTKTNRHVDGLLDGLRFDYDERPKLVHRLDKETSGVLMVARTVQSAAKFTKLFRTKDIQKTYWAFVAGLPKILEGKIDAPLIKKGSASGEKMVVDMQAGDRAISLYRVIDHLGKTVSWLELNPLTGRTHQLRVHCSDILKTPILGDDKYGTRHLIEKEIPQKMYLHAHKIRWIKGKKEMVVIAPVPEHFQLASQHFGFQLS